MAYDLAIIGSGGAAFAAAIAASGQGARVVLVERSQIGGTCVNVGCVPSKTLLAAAIARHGASTPRFPGILTSAGPVDTAALFAGKDALVTQLRRDRYVDLAAGYGWEIIAGDAAFGGTSRDPVLDVALTGGGTRLIEAGQYLVATGAAPWAPPIPGLAEAGYLTSATALNLNRVPESVIVLGGNAIGLELAQLFARLGSRVSVAEALDRLAPFGEPEISAGIEAVLREEGIDVRTGVRAIAVTRGEGDRSVRLAIAGRADQVRAGEVLVATGRRPVTAGLNLETAGVKTGQRGEVAVDDQMRTSNLRVWAAGDVTGGPQFVYVAAAQGALAAGNALAGTGRTLDYTALPWVTFTSPAIASAGMTSAQVAAAGIACDCRVLPLEYVPRALVSRDTRGLVKIVAEAGTGRLLGVHALADGAGELITAASYALTGGMTVGQLADAWVPYLTMAEALRLAAQTYSRDISKLSCCAA